jgi:hypothetical protein
MSSVTTEILTEESQHVNDLGVDPISETSFMSAIPHPVGKIRHNVFVVTLGWAQPDLLGKLVFSKRER